jgi:hypothetical protein
MQESRVLPRFLGPASALHLLPADSLQQQPRRSAATPTYAEVPHSLCARLLRVRRGASTGMSQSRCFLRGPNMREVNASGGPAPGNTA